MILATERFRDRKQLWDNWQDVREEEIGSEGKGNTQTSKISGWRQALKY